MQPVSSRLPDEPPDEGEDLEDTLKLRAIKVPGKTKTLEKEPAGTALPTTPALSERNALEALFTQKLPEIAGMKRPPETPRPAERAGITRGKALALVALLCMLAIQASSAGFAQFIGPQGWAYVLNGPGSTHSNGLITSVTRRLQQSTAVPGGKRAQQITPQQFVDLLMQNMSLDQKLGQMMLVQFTGHSYSLQLSEMINQQNVGGVLIFTVNGNVISRTQLTELIQQMQKDSRGNGLPLAVAIDQEGGRVDRLVNLDGSRPSAGQIGATNDPSKARTAGILDARDLASYGINMNLAPVVDVTSVYNSELSTRTYGNNPAIVTRMASAYLQGLQQSGKVIGTLKHFPGLGDVSTDPHSGLPYLVRPVSQLDTLDWAPYRALIQQGNVHAIMVTHEIVKAVDSSMPSSLSYKIVTGILREHLGFQGVIMTDSLTMGSIANRYTAAEATVLAVEAGSDLIMGASSPQEVGASITALKQAITSGQISQQRIDDSVRRILLMKYQMGQLTIPKS
ncbi:MAG: hypothetical protein M3Y81_00235 [Chloroflexota bacterium]|nr:hypothetical protein [Chloroflexota bacterium]